MLGRRCGTRDLIACVTSIRHSTIIQPYRIAIPNPAGERTRDSAGEGSAPLPPVFTNPFYDLVLLSEAPPNGLTIHAQWREPKHRKNINGKNTGSRRSHKTSLGF